MDGIKVGDAVWAQFVIVDHAGPKAWVYPMTVVHITEDGGILCQDQYRTRLFDESVESLSRSETEAWRACHLRLQEVASEVLRLAGECNAKSKGVTRVVA